MENHAENVYQMLVPDPFLFWQRTQNSYCMQEIIFKMRYFERGLTKTFKKINFIFSFQPSPF